MSTRNDSQLPRVSVVIPTYNRAHLITSALDTVFAQTYPNIEVVVVDDGSTDQTRARLERYGDRVTYVYQRNAGVAIARNTGNAYASGKYIAFMDSDDVWLPNKIVKQVRALEEHSEYAACYCQMGSLNDSGTITRRIEGIKSGYLLEDILLDRAIMTSSTVMVRADVAKSLNGFDPYYKFADDKDLFLRLALQHQFFGLNEALVGMRQGGDNLTLITGARSKEREVLYMLGNLFTQHDLSHYPSLNKARIYAHWYYKIGRYYYANCKRRKARAWFVESIRTNPLRPSVYLNLIATFGGGAGQLFSMKAKRLLRKALPPRLVSVLRSWRSSLRNLGG